MKTIIKKEELRKIILKKRLAKNSIKTSSLIVSKIINSKDFIQADNIALYYPIKNEIDITPILKIKNKNFYLPRCNNQELEFVKFTGFNSLKKGAFGIFEPIGKKINPAILDLIYTPALAANSSFFRLGYGKGFYDRFFSNNQIKAKKIIVISSEFFTNDFIQDPFDVALDGIISEK